MRLCVDGGYLTFKMSFGNFDQWQRTHGEKVSIFAIDNTPKRKEVYPDYKKGRNTGKSEILQDVWALRDRINEEKQLPLCSIEGLEADDLVACWGLFNPDHLIVGVDKDFFQLPNVGTVLYHNLQPYGKNAAIEKLPVYLQELARDNFALYQMLLGDIADNIPRLLSKGKEGKNQIEFLKNATDHGHLAESLQDLFDDQIITNAKLVLIPYYEYCQAEDWFVDWCFGNYYNPKHWSTLYQQMIDCLLPNTTGNEKAVWDLFSLN